MNHRLKARLVTRSPLDQMPCYTNVKTTNEEMMNTFSFICISINIFSAMATISLHMLKFHQTLI